MYAVRATRLCAYLIMSNNHHALLSTRRSAAMLEKAAELSTETEGWWADQFDLTMQHALGSGAIMQDRYICALRE